MLSLDYSHPSPGIANGGFGLPDQRKEQLNFLSLFSGTSSTDEAPSGSNLGLVSLAAGSAGVLAPDGRVKGSTISMTEQQVVDLVQNRPSELNSMSRENLAQMANVLTSNPDPRYYPPDGISVSKKDFLGKIYLNLKPSDEYIQQSIDATKKGFTSFLNGQTLEQYEKKFNSMDFMEQEKEMARLVDELCKAQGVPTPRVDFEESGGTTGAAYDYEREEVVFMKKAQYGKIDDFFQNALMAAHEISHRRDHVLAKQFQANDTSPQAFDAFLMKMNFANYIPHQNGLTYYRQPTEYAAYKVSDEFAKWHGRTTPATPPPEALQLTN